jgi:aminoglycoside 6'-N-acetyltransferase
MENLQFVSLDESHFLLIHQWFNKPHVQSFYSLRSWTFEEVHKKLMLYLQGEKQMKCFIIYYEERPVGYIQSYPIKEHPWENQDLSDEVIQKAAGIDLFIGEEGYLGKGLGREIINQFLEKYIWPFYRYCLADPDIRNETSIRLFRKCRFIEHKQILSKDALHRSVSLQMFIKERFDFQAH